MTEAQFAARFDAGPRGMDGLRRYAELIARWNQRINLFGRNDLGMLWGRHFHDGAMVAAALPERPLRVCDLGSGGGIPGLVIAALRPDVDLVLVDSDARKGAFLREAIREMGGKAAVITARIEHCPGLDADVVTARALAPLSILLGHCRRHLRPTGEALLLKGRNWEAEVAEAARDWTYSHVPSKCGDGVLLRVRDIEARRDR